jgi:hypothetical protein
MKTNHKCKIFTDEHETIEIYPPINLEKGGYAKDENGVILEDKTKSKIKVRSCKECGIVLL